MEDGAEIQHDMGKLKYEKGLEYINNFTIQLKI